ncbi:unnamed protein product [Linum tenue]|uniref:Uncharacterized protein n=1 Tax=Linum tenue TaxID=586396 RepID=A0AAV0QTT7_9ROSI|nr:unnamed protein product [Linum tenue]
MEEGGPAGPKVVRLLYFAGAGFMFTIAVNKWRELERNSMEKQRLSLETHGDHKLLREGPAK